MNSGRKTFSYLFQILQLNTLLHFDLYVLAACLVGWILFSTKKYATKLSEWIFKPGASIWQSKVISSRVPFKRVQESVCWFSLQFCTRMMLQIFVKTFTILQKSWQIFCVNTKLLYICCYGYIVLPPHGLKDGLCKVISGHDNISGIVRAAPRKDRMNHLCGFPFLQRPVTQVNKKLHIREPDLDSKTACRGKKQIVPLKCQVTQEQVKQYSFSKALLKDLKMYQYYKCFQTAYLSAEWQKDGVHKDPETYVLAKCFNIDLEGMKSYMKSYLNMLPTCSPSSQQHIQTKISL